MTLTLIPLGPGDSQLLTLQSLNALKNAEKLVLRTDKHPVADFLKEEGIPFETLDELYETSYDFDELNQKAAHKLWAMAPVCYAVADPAWDETVAALHAACPKGGSIVTLPGVSLGDACLALLPGGRKEAGLTLLPAQDVEGATLCPTRPLLITELNSPVMCGQVKLKLMSLYPDEQEVIFFAPGGKVKKLLLADLDRQKSYDHTACVYLPGLSYGQRDRFDIADLRALLAKLRGPGGCPWDREQTHASLRPYLIEEAYETAAAIDLDDPDQIADELGDVLLQIVFHADVGQQYGEFDLDDVTSAICRKMIRRHAHIFGNVHCDTAQEVSQSWEKIKRQEKGNASLSEMMRDVPTALPQLIRAQKVLKKAGADPRLESLAMDEQALGQWLLKAALTAQQQGFSAEKALEDAIKGYIDAFEAVENANLSGETP
ncbi:MAG: MazG family protein [Clostridia bacterium]|nr:MazG family protein [Clostridia bacterium]